MPRPLEDAVRANDIVTQILTRWSELGLPGAWLVAGVVVQSAWNSAHGFPPLYGLSDVDIIYFDDGDLTEQTEAEHAARIEQLFSEVDVRFDVKNEARVHLWYEQRFGYPIPAYSSAEAAIATFPTTAGAIGIRPAGAHIEVCAPFGFDDLLQLIVRPNQRQVTADIYRAKVERWAVLWPRLNIIPWDTTEPG